MHSQESDRIRQAEAYYANHDRFAPGEEEAIAAYQARREAEARPLILSDDTFVTTGYCLLAATAAAAVGAFPGDDADDARIASASFAWVHEATKRLSSNVFVEHPDLRGLYEGVVDGLVLATEVSGRPAEDAIAAVFAGSNPRNRPAMEASADTLAVLLAATSIGIAIFPQFQTEVYAAAWQRNVRAFVPNALNLGLQFDSDQGAGFMEACRDTLAEGAFPFNE